MADTKQWSSGHQYILASSDYSTFGEFTETSIGDICRVLSSIVGYDSLSKCTVIDLGSGRGKLAVVVQERLAVRAVVGVEMDMILHTFAQQNSLHTSCVLAKGDITTIENLYGIDIVLAFDRAMGDNVREHICRLFNNSHEPMILMSCFKNLRESAGLHAQLWPVSARASMSGSGEKHTMYFYVNQDRLAAKRQNPDGDYWSSILEDAAALNAAASKHRHVAVQCVSDVLSGKVLRSRDAADRSMFVPELLAVTLCDSCIINAVRELVCKH
eukprot:GDKI01048255.1.p1 GENE.GDKI01048255.1~~GDKI01048255.1.p1  ORF type:complete len:271 (-),score=18.39 GDKI01048255.1:77-889(-)